MRLDAPLRSLLLAWAVSALLAGAVLWPHTRQFLSGPVPLQPEWSAYDTLFKGATNGH